MVAVVLYRTYGSQTEKVRVLGEARKGVPAMMNVGVFA